MYILPNVEGLMQCDESLVQKKLLHASEAFRFCMDRGLNGAAPLKRLLDALEPGGPQGKVQVGYTLTVQLLELYRPGAAGGWELDEKRLDAIMNLMKQARRPLVLYLSSSHFDSIGPLPAALAKDPANLMKAADGQPLKLSYFGYPIHPYTLIPDERIDVNRYRYQALREIARRVGELPEDVQRLIVAVTLVGEVHHLFPDFENGTGNFTQVRVTDYDPRSIAAFRTWLKDKYQTLARFNQATGFAYTDIDQVPAPSKDIRHKLPVTATRCAKIFSMWQYLFCKTAAPSALYASPEPSPVLKPRSNSCKPSCSGRCCLLPYWPFWSACV